MTVRIKTGLRKDGTFEENLEAVRVAVARYGVETVIDRLQEIKGVFYWIKSDPQWEDWIDQLVVQLEYDAYVLPRLIEEIEITEFAQGPNGSFGTRKKKIRVVIDPTKGASNGFKGVLY